MKITKGNFESDENGNIKFIPCKDGKFTVIDVDSLNATHFKAGIDPYQELKILPNEDDIQTP